MIRRGKLNLIVLASAFIAVATPAWVRAAGPVPAAAAAAPRLADADVKSLLRAIAGADLNGLRAGAFLRTDAQTLLSSSDPVRRAQGEAQLLEAAALYGQALRGGRLAERDFRGDWHIRPASYDVRADLAQALAAGRLDAWLTALAPPYDGYRALLPVLARYRALAAQGGWALLDTRKAIKAADQGDAVAALRARLALEGFASPPTLAPALFDGGLQEALTRFQRARGLTPDGVAGRATLQALDVPAEARVAAIEANLERWRWAPRGLPPRRVEVNIAAAELRGFDAGRPVVAMRTVVGRPADPTPMFADQIEAVVFNPPWNVPAGIAAKEILPKARRDPSYLARQGFVFIGEGANRRLQQKAGPTSALGLFKFDLPNPYSVFLHDTPVRSVFAADRRALSHGCVRLQQPRDLAIWALDATPAWNAAAIDAAVASGATVSARLAAPLPVLLYYWTAFVDDDGEVNFRDDIYGWDRDLNAALR